MEIFVETLQNGQFCLAVSFLFFRPIQKQYHDTKGNCEGGYVWKFLKNNAKRLVLSTPPDFIFFLPIKKHQKKHNNKIQKNNYIFCKDATNALGEESSDPRGERVL